MPELGAISLGTGQALVKTAVAKAIAGAEVLRQRNGTQVYKLPSGHFLQVAQPSDGSMRVVVLAHSARLSEGRQLGLVETARNGGVVTRVATDSIEAQAEQHGFTTIVQSIAGEPDFARTLEAGVKVPADVPLVLRPGQSADKVLLELCDAGLPLEIFKAGATLGGGKGPGFKRTLRTNCLVSRLDNGGTLIVDTLNGKVRDLVLLDADGHELRLLSESRAITRHPPTVAGPGRTPPRFALVES